MLLLQQQRTCSSSSCCCRGDGGGSSSSSSSSSQLHMKAMNVPVAYSWNHLELANVSVELCAGTCPMDVAGQTDDIEVVLVRVVAQTLIARIAEA